MIYVKELKLISNPVIYFDCEDFVSKYREGKLKLYVSHIKVITPKSLIMIIPGIVNLQLVSDNWNDIRKLFELINYGQLSCSTIYSTGVLSPNYEAELQQDFDVIESELDTDLTLSYEQLCTKYRGHIVNPYLKYEPEVSAISGLSYRNDKITVTGINYANAVDFKNTLIDTYEVEDKEEMGNMNSYVSDIMWNKDINKILINENEGVVSVIGVKQDITLYRCTQSNKVVTMSKTIEGDTFDRYIGSAFALGYFFYGSKTQFNKHLKEFYGCAPQELDKCALIDMYTKFGGKANFEKYIDTNAKYVIKEKKDLKKDKKVAPKKKPKSKKDKE